MKHPSAPRVPTAVESKNGRAPKPSGRTAPSGLFPPLLQVLVASNDSEVQHMSLGAGAWRLSST